MKKKLSSVMFYIGSFAACSVMALASGCASGGFQLTRKYAGFVNEQNIVIRIILYLLTFIVFWITILVDMVIFNTIDFWEGHVSAGTYNFQKADRTYQVKHEILPDSNLKRSTIQVTDLQHHLLQTVVLSETKSGEIEMYVDGVLRTRVHGIKEIPTAAIYNKDGKLIAENIIPLTNHVLVSK